MQITSSSAAGLPALPQDMIAALNNVARWLALDEFTARRDTLDIDAIVLAGNSVLTTIEGACRLAKERDVPLFISGGIGHSTALLALAVSQHPRYRTIPTEGRPEADVLTTIATGFWQIPEHQVIRETASRNCGENAAFSRALIEKAGISAGNVVLIQDPLLQRRTDATFRFSWSGAGQSPTFINWPTYVPQLISNARGTAFFGDAEHNPWPLDRFITLLLGEIPRLMDDKNGYGPKGKNFLVHVDIPLPVAADWRYLMQHPLLTANLHDRV